MADSLRLSGLATGLDTSSLITQLMSIERKPIRIMQATQKLAQSRIDMYRVINTKMIALQRAAEKVIGMNFAAGNAGSAASATSSVAGILNPTATSTAVAGSYNVNVISLARAQITGGGGFSMPAATRTGSVGDPTRFTATVGAATPVGSYSINVQSLAQVQKNGGAAFSVPGNTVSVVDTSKYTASLTGSSTPGTYGVEVTRLAGNQVSGGGAFTSPTITATSGNPARYSVAVTGTPASQTSAVTVNSLLNQQVYTGGAFSTAGNRTLTITNSTTGTPTNISFSNATHTNVTLSANRINEFTASTGVTATVSGGRLVLTGSNGDAFTLSGTVVTQGRMGLSTGSNTSTASKASITVGGSTYSQGTSNVFTNVAGLTITALAAGAGGNMTVTNQSGSLRITDSLGNPTDVAIAAYDDINTVVSKINTANTGMTASTDGTTITLTGNTVGEAFTIGDAPGTTGLAAQLGLTPLVQDARAGIKINGGAEITSTTNTFTNPTGLSGVTINAAAPGTSNMTIAAGGGTLRITNTGAGTSADVAIAAGDDINTVMTKINAAGSGMTAAIVGGQLELTGNTAGETFTVADAGGGNALAVSLGIASVTQAASLASISINGGAAITSATNTFNNPGVLTGTTINALATGTTNLTVADQAGTLRITNTSAGTFKDIAIDSSWTLNQVVNAINGANTGMTATTDGTALTLTGITNATDFTIADAGGGSALASALGIDSATRTTQTAQQASLSVDGGAVQTSNTNTFTNPIAGVNLTVSGLGSTVVNVTAEVAATAGSNPVDAVKDMVDKYNDVISYIRENASYNAETKKAGALLSDSTVTSLKNNLSKMMTGMVDVNSTYYNGYSTGLTLQRDGSVSFDASKFQAAINADASAVQNLFTLEDGLTVGGAKTLAIGKTGQTGDGIATRLAGFVQKMISQSSQYNTIDPTRGLRTSGALLGAIQNNELTISRLDKRIEEYEIRLKEKERGLLAKFQAMEKSVAMIRNQGNYFAGAYSSMLQQTNR